MGEYMRIVKLTDETKNNILEKVNQLDCRFSKEVDINLASCINDNNIKCKPQDKRATTNSSKNNIMDMNL
jgi:hypothetical protein